MADNPSGEVAGTTALPGPVPKKGGKRKKKKSSTAPRRRKDDKSYRRAIDKLKKEMPSGDRKFKRVTRKIRPGAESKQLYLWHSDYQQERLFIRWGGYKKFRNNPKFWEIHNVMEKVKGKRVFDNMLEVGCGHGHWLYHWRRISKKIVGLDHSYGMVESCKMKLRKVGKNMKFVQGDCWNLPFPDESFNFVFMVDVTMHIGGSWAAIEEMLRVSKDYVMFTGPSWMPPMWKKTKKNQPTKTYRFHKEQSDMQISYISWAINQTLIEERLNKMKDNNEIKEWWYEKRTSTPAYNHKILIVRKGEN